MGGAKSGKKPKAFYWRERGAGGAGQAHANVKSNLTPAFCRVGKLPAFYKLPLRATDFCFSSSHSCSLELQVNSFTGRKRL